MEDSEIKDIKKDVAKKINTYRKLLDLMAADAPIQILCLPKEIEKPLLDHGFLRVYDLINADLTKVKRLGDVRIRHLTSCLDEFLSMC